MAPCPVSTTAREGARLSLTNAVVTAAQNSVSMALALPWSSLTIAMPSRSLISIMSGSCRGQRFGIGETVMTRHELLGVNHRQHENKDRAGLMHQREPDRHLMHQRQNAERGLNGDQQSQRKRARHGRPTAQASDHNDPMEQTEPPKRIRPHPGPELPRQRVLEDIPPQR